MKTSEATQIFEALSSGIRLELFRLLVKNAPDGLIAGDIARELNLPGNNLSFHLKALVHSGLCEVEREGRFLRYRANIKLMLQVVAYLTEECCSGNPDLCLEFKKELTVSACSSNNQKGEKY